MVVVRPGPPAGRPRSASPRGTRRPGHRPDLHAEVLDGTADPALPSHSADSAAPIPGVPNRVRASRQTHSPTGGRWRETVRSGLMNELEPNSSSARMPLPKSAAATARCRGRLLARHHRARAGGTRRWPVRVGRVRPVTNRISTPSLWKAGAVADDRRRSGPPGRAGPGAGSSGTVGSTAPVASGRPGCAGTATQATSDPVWARPPCRPAGPCGPAVTTRLVTASGAMRHRPEQLEGEPDQLQVRRPPGRRLDGTGHQRGHRPPVQRLGRPRPPGQLGRHQASRRRGRTGRRASPVPAVAIMGATLPVAHRVASAPTIGRSAGLPSGRHGPPCARHRAPAPDTEPKEHHGTGTAEIDIDGSPDAVWAVVGDFGGIAGWMPGMDSCRVEGDNRILDTMGMTITEKLVAKDDAARAITYSIVDGVPVESPRGHHHRDRRRRRQPRHLGGRRRPRTRWPISCRPSTSSRSRR